MSHSDYLGAQAKQRVGRNVWSALARVLARADVIQSALIVCRTQVQVCLRGSDLVLPSVGFTKAQNYGILDGQAPES